MTSNSLTIKFQPLRQASMSTSAYSSYLKSQKVDFLADHDNGDGWTVSLSATLREEKLAVSHLSTRDSLRRDYNEYSFRAPASDDATQYSNVIQAENSTKEIEDWLAERDLSVLGVLTTFRNKNDKGRREQLWVIKAADEAVAAKLWSGLESSEELGLERFSFSKFIGNTDTAEESEVDDAKEVATDEAFGESCIARAYKQGVKSASRKQIAPILRRVMEGMYPHAASNILSTLLGRYTYRYIHKYCGMIVLCYRSGRRGVTVCQESPVLRNAYSYNISSVLTSIMSRTAATSLTLRQKAVQCERSTSMLASEILNFGTSHHAAAVAEVHQKVVQGD
ncbi:hypothetical protein DFH29DRAFT_1071286 [Suillus ampliporus]|nr:hypothetical protein DFH29DRAFT_1071286 [Suillus ampliporus]